MPPVAADVERGDDTNDAQNQTVGLDGSTTSTRASMREVPGGIQRILPTEMHTKNLNTLGIDLEATFGCDQWPLHFACRTGNLKNVRYLVDVMKMPLEEQDAHDATPLYLAALTGNNAICQFLLERGAKCDPDSGGDAARVFYVALTPELRQLLRAWSLSAASRDPFLDMLRRMYHDPSHSDVTAHIDGMEIYLHSIVLRARCRKIHALLQEEPSGTGVQYSLEFPARHDASMLLQLLNYLYTGVFEARDVESTLLAQELAFRYGLTALFRRLRVSLKKREKMIEVARNGKPKRRAEKQDGGIREAVERYRFETADLSLARSEMATMARSWASIPHDEWDDINEMNELVQSSDVTVQCCDATWSLHSVILCAQSEYFRGALEGGFREATEALIDLSHLMPSRNVVRLAIQWMYGDDFFVNDIDGYTGDNGHDDDDDDGNFLQEGVQLIELATALLCPRLVAHAVNKLVMPAVDDENALDLIELARMHDLERLEQRCVDVIASNLHQFVVDNEQFIELLAEDSASILQGGDINVADIPLAAEIRSSMAKLDLGAAERIELNELLAACKDRALARLATS